VVAANIYPRRTTRRCTAGNSVLIGIAVANLGVYAAAKHTMSGGTGCGSASGQDMGERERKEYLAAHPDAGNKESWILGLRTECQAPAGSAFAHFTLRARFSVLNAGREHFRAGWRNFSLLGESLVSLREDCLNNAGPTRLRTRRQSCASRP